MIKDVIWSTSVQHGAEDAALVIQRALAGQNLTKMTDKEIITRLYRFAYYEVSSKIPTNSEYRYCSERGADKGMKYFSNEIESVKRSILDRFKEEQKTAIARLN